MVGWRRTPVCVLAARNLPSWVQPLSNKRAGAECRVWLTAAQGSQGLRVRQDETRNRINDETTEWAASSRLLQCLLLGVLVASIAGAIRCFIHGEVEYTDAEA